MAKKRLKKLLASALAVSMAATLLPAAVMANADAEIVNEPIALEMDSATDAEAEAVPQATTQLLTDAWAGAWKNMTSANFDASYPNYKQNQKQIIAVEPDTANNTVTVYADIAEMETYELGGAPSSANWCTIGITLPESGVSFKDGYYVLLSSDNKFTPDGVTASEKTGFRWVGAAEGKKTNFPVSVNGEETAVVVTTKSPSITTNTSTASIAQEEKVNVDFTPDLPEGAAVQISANNDCVAVSQSGNTAIITGKNPGVAEVSATATLAKGEGNMVVTAKCTVTVAEKSSTGGDAIVTPEPTTTVDPSVTPDPSETPDASVTPEPTGTPGTITPEPTNTPEPTPTEPVKKGDEVETKAGTVVVTNTKTNTVAFDTVDDAATTVTIPKTVKIDGVAYTVTTIKASAFADSKKLTNVTIPATITAIGKNAFAGCSKLTKVTVKSTKLKAIKANTFKDCKALTSISLPKSVTSIGKNVFSGCSKLKTITIKATTLKVKKGAFKGIAKNAVIKVPKSKVKAFSKILKKAGFKGKVKAI